MEEIAKLTYVKVFNQILDSTIADNYELRHFFEDMLKLAQWKTGVVDMTPAAISRRLNCPLEKVMWGLGELEKPDPQSRRHELDGRRIVRMEIDREWGWRIVNYEHYKQGWSGTDKREYDRLAKRAERDRKKKPGRSMAKVRAQAEAGERTYTASINNGQSAEEATREAEQKENEFRE